VSAAAKGVFLRLGAAFVAAVVVTPVIASFVLPDERWHRVATRSFLIAVVLAFASGAGHPRTWPDRLCGLGMRGPHRARGAAFGALLAIGLMLALLVAQLALGGRDATMVPHRRGLLEDLGLALFTATLVAVVEEILCRGYLKETVGGPMSALLYAGAHYFRPMHPTAPAGDYDPLLVLRRFPDLMEGWLVPNHLAFGLPSLFLFGLALNRLKDRTGSLYPCIGVHFGVVLGLKLYDRWVERTAEGSAMIWGSSRIHDGLLGLLAMALLLLWAYRGPLPGSETERLRPT